MVWNGGVLVEKSKKMVVEEGGIEKREERREMLEWKTKVNGECLGAWDENSMAREGKRQQWGQEYERWIIREQMEWIRGYWRKVD